MNLSKFVPTWRINWMLEHAESLEQVDRVLASYIGHLPTELLTRAHDKAVRMFRGKDMLEAILNDTPRSMWLERGDY